jgi:hypothetical protein
MLMNWINAGVREIRNAVSFSGAGFDRNSHLAAT